MSFATAYFVEQRKEAEGRDGGCPPLWLLSGGQAKESDSPKGETEDLLSELSVVI